MASKDGINGHDTIIMRRSWAKSLRRCPDHSRLEYYDKLMDFIITRVYPNDEATLCSLLAPIFDQMIEYQEKYASTCEKRAEAGRKGARSKQANANKTSKC